MTFPIPGFNLQLWILTVCFVHSLLAEEEEFFQYNEGPIEISSASAEEPIAKPWSLNTALKHLDDGARAWTTSKQCISCHTNGSYMMIRPSLTSIAGPPDASIRSFFVEELATLEQEETDLLQSGIQPTQLAYLAAGLASWDLHVTGDCTQETDRSIALMFKAQSKNGSFGNDDCWPPLESSSYHAATVAAIAVTTAPGWLDRMRSDASLGPSIQNLKQYLINTPPPHAYAQVLLAWAEHYWPGLQHDFSKDNLVSFVSSHQQKDGGWALRSFASPEHWGNGSRAQKIRSEPNFEHPESDGHMTGLICMVLRLHGVEPSNPTLARGLSWLKHHQRISGRWWTRSLNTDRYHFITYSSTCYAVMALTMP